MKHLITFKYPELLPIYLEYKENKGNCCENILPMCKLCNVYLELFELKKQKVLQEKDK